MFILVIILLVAIAFVLYSRNKRKRRISRRQAASTRPRLQAKPQPKPVLPKPKAEPEPLPQEQPEPEPPKPQLKLEPEPKPEPQQAPKPQKPEPEPQRPPQPEPKPQPAEKISIEEFFMEEEGKIAFTNDLEQARTQLQSLADVSAMMRIIEASDYEHKDAYAKKLQQYSKDLQKKLLDNLEDLAEEPEEISYNITSSFVKIIQRSLMKLLRPIYLSNSRDVAFNRAFLQELKAYLARCGFGTMNIAPGSRCDDRALEAMNIFFTDTADKAKDRLITEVEQLPYIIRYLDEDGEPVISILDGTMAVLRYRSQG